VTQAAGLASEVSVSPTHCGISELTCV